MDKNAEIQNLKAEISFIQNEIDRRHQRVDDDVDRQRNLEKIDQLREKREDLKRRLQNLQPD